MPIIWRPLQNCVFKNVSYWVLLLQTYRLIPTCNSWLFWKVQKWLEHFQWGCSNLIFVVFILLRETFKYVVPLKCRERGWDNNSVGLFLEVSMLTLKCPNGKQKQKQLKKKKKAPLFVNVRANMWHVSGNLWFGYCYWKLLRWEDQVGGNVFKALGTISSIYSKCLFPCLLKSRT